MQYNFPSVLRGVAPTNKNKAFVSSRAPPHRLQTRIHTAMFCNPSTMWLFGTPLCSGSIHGASLHCFLLLRPPKMTTPTAATMKTGLSGSDSQSCENPIIPLLHTSTKTQRKRSGCTKLPNNKHISCDLPSDARVCNVVVLFVSFAVLKQGWAKLQRVHFVLIFVGGTHRRCLLFPCPPVRRQTCFPPLDNVSLFALVVGAVRPHDGVCRADSHCSH